MKLRNDTILSARESQIVEFASQGLTDQKIAAELGISAATVASYWARIRSKLGVTSRTHAVALQMQKSGTKNKKGNGKSEESELLPVLRQVLDQNPDPVAVLTEDGRVTYANRAFTQALEKPTESVCEATLERLFSSPAAQKQWKEMVDETLGDHLPHTYSGVQGLPALSQEKMICYPAGKAKDGRSLVVAMFLLLL